MREISDVNKIYMERITKFYYENLVSLDRLIYVRHFTFGIWQISNFNLYLIHPLESAD
jgi:hypothetical protein